MLSLLGPPTLSVSGGVPAVPQPGSKALALLAFLVLEPHPHSRETLAALLWGSLRSRRPAPPSARRSSSSGPGWASWCRATGG